MIAELLTKWLMKIPYVRRKLIGQWQAGVDILGRQKFLEGAVARMTADIGRRTDAELTKLLEVTRSPNDKILDEHSAMLPDASLLTDAIKLYAQAIENELFLREHKKKYHQEE